jgi:Gas vesicle synthesis protein GvpL/GvpF
VLYLYALTEQPTVLPSTAGLEGTPLGVEELDGLDAVVGELGRERIEPTEEAVLAHARIVEELTAVNEAVLPARFGRGYQNAQALRVAVAEQGDALRQALDRVRGCLELGLRVLAKPGDAAGPAQSGREYMLGRLDQRRRAERLADEVHGPLAELARADTRTVGATPQLLLSAAYLVPRDTVDRFRSTLTELETAHPELSLACTGPWPPYSFATVEVEAR